jgi:hypothetical protein
METEANNIRAQALKMSWYMRGGSTYEDVLNMSTTERKLISELIKENLETTSRIRPWVTGRLAPMLAVPDSNAVMKFNWALTLHKIYNLLLHRVCLITKKS